MTDIAPPLSLPALQRRLDALPPNGRLTLAVNDYRRLFGVNDVAHERMNNFARGHGCTADATPSAITFRKASVRA